MKKVLHITHTDVSTDARILRQLEALSEMPELSVEAIGVTGTGEPTASAPVPLKQYKALSFRARWLPRPVQYLLALVEINTRALADIARIRPDIVHCHDTMVLPSGAVAAAVARSTLIYDAHELESDKSSQTPALSRATLWIERACWRQIDALISVSPAILEWYTQKFGPKPSLLVLNSPKIRRSDGPSSTGEGTLRSELGLNKETPLFVYVGILGFGRGIESILKSFTEGTTDVHIAFVGWGDLEEEILRASYTRPNVHLHKPVPHDALVDFIKDADGAFCLIEDVSLSDHYCLPNKLFEYAFAGLPVVASRLPEISRVVEDYDLGVLTDADPGSLRRAVRECLLRGPRADDERLKDLSWESQAEGLVALYTSL